MFRYVYAMAQNDQKIFSSLSDSAIPLIRHIIKLIYFPNVQEYNHWKREVFKFLNYVDKRKANNKYPKYNFIYSALSSHNDIMDNLISTTLDEMVEEPADVDYDTAYSIIDSYLQWISQELATSGKISNTACYEKLDELLSH